MVWKEKFGFDADLDADATLSVETIDFINDDADN